MPHVAETLTLNSWECQKQSLVFSLVFDPLNHASNDVLKSLSYSQDINATHFFSILIKIIVILSV